MHTLVAVVVQADAASDHWLYTERFSEHRTFVQVMVIGIGCTMSDWTPRLLRALAAIREVIIFDNAGIGQSEIAPGGTPAAADYFRFQAQTVAGLISAIGLTQPDILGW
jgi:pimeloyl-ACP methyl ester carboxylesterase